MQEQPPHPKKHHRTLWIGVALFVFALSIRLLGIGWGLRNELHNASYHPDEPIILANSQMIVPGLGRFTPTREIPRFYSYGTLYLILLRVASDVTSTYWGDQEITQVGSGFKGDWKWISRCHLAGRVISAAAGAGTVWVLFVLMLKQSGEWAGIASGLLVAIAPAHVLHSRFQTVDVLATFFLALSMHYALKIIRREAPGTMRLALQCGLFAGLSAGTKYTGLLAIFSLIAAATLVDWRKALGPVFAGIAVACLAFVLTTPGVVMQTDSFMKDLAFEMSHTSTGHGLLFTGVRNGYLYTLTTLLVGIGPIPVVLGLCGLGYAACKRHSWSWVLLAFFVPYLIVIGRSQVNFARYSFPLYVGIAAGFGYTIQVCQRRGGWSRGGVALGILGVGGLPFGGLATCGAVTASMMGEDARDEAARYLHTVAGPIGLVHSPWFWTAAIFPDAADPGFVSLRMKLRMAAESRPPIELVIDESGQAPGWSMELLEKQKPPVVSFSSYEYFPILRLKGRRDLGEQQAELDSATNFLGRLQEGWSIDRQFGSPNFGGPSPELLPEDLLYTEPVIYVWKQKG